MVGIAGGFGETRRDLTPLTRELSHFGDEASSEYETDDAFVTTVGHCSDAVQQPVSVPSTDELMWFWGNVYGYLDEDGEYVSKETVAPELSDAEYCAHLYNELGSDFIAGANGSFTGTIYNRATGDVRLFTDRLGSRPMHYIVTGGTAFVSTQIQALCRLLGDELQFEPDYVTEYFSFERALGRKTPVDGIELAHPGAITDIDLSDSSTTIDVKWRPVHDPQDRSFEEFADLFAETFESAVTERYDAEESSGVLLSGGSDSRLILGALPDGGVTGYHINDWRNREAEMAERVADATGNKFEFLERDGEAYTRAVTFSSAVSNYSSWFQHGHASGFAGYLRDNVDCLMTGHYSDTLFKHNYLPYRGILIPGTTVEVPVYLQREVETVEELVSLYLGTKFHNRKHLRAPPSYLRTSGLRGILERNITADGERVSHHGVRHESPADAALFSECYPLTNTAGRLFFDVMLQTAPFRDPFLDVRLVELMTRLPIRYRLRKNIINTAVANLNPTLAEIPHPKTNIALKRPFAAHYVALQVNWALDRVRENTKPVPYYTQGSWPNWDELLRHHDIAMPILEEGDDLLETIDWIDRDKLWEDYRSHMDGENRFDELSAAVSFLSAPGTAAVFRPRTVSAVGSSDTT